MDAPRESLHKAAVLLSSLPSQQRTQLLGRLEPRQTAAVASEMTGLRAVAGAEREAVVREFAGAKTARPAERRQRLVAPFEFLYDLDRQCLLDMLGGEHPQTLALVLSYLPPRQAGEVLAELSPGQQFAIICRIATMIEPSPEIISDVENVLRRLSDAANHPAGDRRFAGVIRMLNRMAPSAERMVLAKLAKADPQLVREIRRAMFSVDVAACEEWEMTGVAC